MKYHLLSLLTLLGIPFCVNGYVQTIHYSVSADTLKNKLQGGSVDVVTQDRMNKGLVMNPLEALNGQAAGVNVTTVGSNPMAMLNSVRVRGTTSLTGGNDPLVIIDGVSSDLATLSSIYPADIESFNILKNVAETACYGSRGASGVIEVTTKKGQGGQFHIAYGGNMGMQRVAKNIKMLLAQSYVETAARLGLDCNNGGFDTDFPASITRTGWVQSHHLAFSGGTEASHYRASLGFMDNRTVVQDNGYQNFVAKLDLSQKAFDDRLTIDMGVFGSSQTNEDIFDEQKLFYSAASQNPTFSTEQNAGGGWDKNSTASQINPPQALLREKDDTKFLNFNSHLRLQFQLTSDLSLSAFGSYSYSSQENAQFCPTWVWAQGQAARGEQKSEDWLGNLVLDYGHTWGLHRLDVKVLGEYQKRRSTGFWTLVKGFTSNEFGYHNLGAGSIRPYGGTGSSYEDPSLGSVLGSISYAWKDRYKLAFSTRSDGSSMVGSDHTWGFFPSVSAEWDAKAERFLQEVDWLSRLQVRSGYGQSGNLGGISSYNSLRLLQQNGVVPVFDKPIVTMGIIRNDNPDLKWETRSTFNVGTDWGLFHNRVLLTAEYYYSKTTDMLYEYDVPVPPFTFDKLLANIGSMSNSGFELGLSVTPLQTQEMELNINVNMAWQKNKLISLSGDYNGSYMTAPDITNIGSLNGAGFHGGNNNIVYQIVGQPLGVFYLPHCTGLTQAEDGSYRYELADLNGDGTVSIDDQGDRYIAGQATPKMTLGSNIGFRYRNVDISVQINGAFGHKIYNGTSLTYMNMASFPDYNVMPGAPEQNIKDQTASDYWLEKGNYLNFDYLTLGWNIPLPHVKYINSLRLSCSVNNLATITGYSGLTPMINSYVVSNTLGIDDKRSYPVYRSYSLGFSIQF
ncbi:MAG: SusC/RagA family TonB-linked outer membrane protein [Parabacteroides sp.]